MAQDVKPLPGLRSPNADRVVSAERQDPLAVGAEL